MIDFFLASGGTIQQRFWFLFSHRYSRPSRPQLTLLLLLLGLPLKLFAASDFELVEIAQKLTANSLALAEERRNAQSFAGISQRASRLARETGQLIDSIRRTRNSAAIEARFSNVSKRYTELEDIYWRRSRDESDPYIVNQLVSISTLYSQLSGAFYASRHFQTSPSIVIFAAPSIGTNGGRVPPVLINGLVGSAYSLNNRNRIRVTIPSENAELLVE